MKTKNLDTQVLGWRTWWGCVAAHWRALAFPLWSGIYSGLVEDELGPREFVPVDMLNDLAVQLVEQKYQPDSFRQLGDAMHSGAWLSSMWGLLLNGCDCDDFASFSCHVVKHSPKLEKVYTPWLLSVFTKDAGHAVALFHSELGYRWVDYGKPSPLYPTLLEAVESVAKAIGGERADYFVMSPPR